MALVDVTLERGGKTFEAQQALVFHVSDGKVTEAWVMSTDPYAFDAFWS